MTSISDGVLRAYRRQAEKMHVGDTVSRPDGVSPVGETADARIYRVWDGWGEYYFADPRGPGGEAEYVACKMPDVMAVDYAPKYRGKIEGRLKALGRGRVSMGDAAWDRAVVEAVGGEMADTKDVDKAEWDAATINDLPDSSFAYIEPGGGRDDQGKTVPRSLRHLPYKDAGGKVDHPHLRNALARLSQTDLPKGTQARVRAKLERVAAEHGVGEHAEKQGPGTVRWPVMPRPEFRGSSLTDAGEKAPNQKEDDDGTRKHAFLVKVREAIKAAAGPGSRVQSLLFDKGKYPKVEDAQGWANDHGFKSGKVDSTGEFHRLRQEDPDSLFARMRIISLTEGVRAVVGVPRKTIKAIQDAFFLTIGGRLAFKAADLSAATLEPVEESEDGLTVWKVECGGRSVHFAEAGGIAAALDYTLLRKDQYVVVAKSEGNAADELRYTLGVVYPASKRGKPEPDFHGDVMSDEEIRKSAWGFMGKGTDRVGLMHRPGTSGAGRVVESYTWPAGAPEWKLKDSSGEEQSVGPGDWMLGVVWEPEAWAAVKSGNIRGYSLQGAAHKEAVE